MRYMHTLQKKLAADGIGWRFSDPVDSVDILPQLNMFASILSNKKIIKNDTCSPCSLTTSPNRIGPVAFPPTDPFPLVGRGPRVQEGFGAGYLDDFAGLLHHEAELRVVPGTLQLAGGGASDESDAVWMAIRQRR